MENIEKPKKYDLEERAFEFAKEVRLYVKKLPQNVVNLDDCRQVIRSSGSIGANYIEANEALGQKDFLMRIRISRKEAKETIYWLKLLRATNPEHIEKSDSLIQESIELMAIFGSILRKSTVVKSQI
jgi:four helix bundle protein